MSSDLERNIDLKFTDTQDQVAGLVAYALALEQVPFVGGTKTPISVGTWLINAASWVRQPPNGPRVIWNREQGY